MPEKSRTINGYKNMPNDDNRDREIKKRLYKPTINNIF